MGWVEIFGSRRAFEFNVILMLRVDRLRETRNTCSSTLHFYTETIKLQHEI